MNKGKLIILSLLGTLCFASLGLASGAKIGMITTLSGGGAGLGIDVRDGFLLALNQTNNPEVEFVVEDDQRAVDVAVQLADRMIQSEKVDILTGIIWSNLALAVVPGVVQQDVFYLSPNAGPSALAGANCHPNYFNVAWQNDNLHEAAGGYANNAGYQNSVIIAPNYPAGIDALNGYKRYFEGNIISEIYTKLGQDDYAAEIAQIRAAEADSVFFFLPAGMGIAFLKQYAQSGVDTPLVGPAFSFDQGILQAVGEAALGVRNTSQWSKDINNPTNQKFVEDFLATYGRLPSLYASQGFDTANLILSALESADVGDADAFRAALEAADFDSVRGKFSFGSNHHPVQDIYVREVIQEGDVFTNKIIEVAMQDHADIHATNCPM